MKMAYRIFVRKQLLTLCRSHNFQVILKIIITIRQKIRLHKNSSPKAVDCSTEVDSQGKIQLSEFDETVDYNTGELSDDGDSSSNSSSGRSPDENDKDEPVNKKQKPDLSKATFDYKEYCKYSKT